MKVHRLIIHHAKEYSISFHHAFMSKFTTNPFLWVTWYYVSGRRQICLNWTIHYSEYYHVYCVTKHYQIAKDISVGIIQPSFYSFHFSLLFVLFHFSYCFAFSFSLFLYTFFSLSLPLSLSLSFSFLFPFLFLSCFYFPFIFFWFFSSHILLIHLSSMVTFTFPNAPVCRIPS